MSRRFPLSLRAVICTVFLCALFPVSAYAQECDAPKSLGDVLVYVRSRLPVSRIVSLLETGCVSFRMGEAETDAFHEAGATEEVLVAITSVLESGRLRYVPPPTNQLGLPVVEPVALVSDWVRAEGTRVYYRYKPYLDVPCSDRVRAVGNWANYGWDYRRGIHVQCIDDEWLAFDLAEKVADRSAVPGLNYCFNVADGNTTSDRTRWGQHGSRSAPGLTEGSLNPIVVLGPNREPNIGFQVVPSDSGAAEVQIKNGQPVAQGKC